MMAGLTGASQAARADGWVRTVYLDRSRRVDRSRRSMTGWESNASRSNDFGDQPGPASHGPASPGSWTYATRRGNEIAVAIAPDSVPAAAAAWTISLVDHAHQSVDA